jgi:thiamine biosynthesis protein ThiI
MKNIIERTLEVGAKILNLEDTFALRVKRSGDHDFSSQDVARKAGKAILDHFPHLNLQVDLGAPDKIINIEVRGEFSYIFTDIIISKWKGLPIKETRKILVMDIGRQYDLLAGMFLMRRGCKIKPIMFKITNNQEEWNKRISNWRKVISFTPFTEIRAFQIDLTESLNIVHKKLGNSNFFCSLCRLIRFKVIGRLLDDGTPELQEYMAVTDGFTHNNISLCPDETDLQTMVFCDKLLMTPLIGFGEKKVNTYLSYISDDLYPIDYCKYKPEAQRFDSATLKELYSSLKIDNLITTLIKTQKEVIIQ